MPDSGVKIRLYAENYPGRFFAVTGSLFYTLILAFAFYRAGLPWNNGDFEDAVLQGSMHLLNGESLYQPASASYVPAIYGPALYYATAFFSYILGPTMLAGRLPSLFSLVFLPLVLFWIFRVSGGSRSSALEGTGLVLGVLASLFFPARKWLDLAKVDALFLFATALLVLFLLRSGVSFKKRDPILAGLLAASLFFIKQTGLAFSLAGGLWLLLFFPFRKALLYSATFLVSLCSTIIFFQYRTDGLFFHYTVMIPALHPLSGKGAGKEFLTLLGFLVSGILLSLFFYSRPRLDFRFHRWREEERNHALLAGLALTSFPVSFLGRLKAGGVTNSFFYTGLLMALYFAFLVSSRRKENVNRVAFSGEGRGILFPVLFLLLVVSYPAQLFQGRFDPVKEFGQLHKKWTKVDQHIRDLCSLPEKTFFFYFSYLPVLHCGRPEQFSYSLAIDILLDDGEFDRFLESTRERMRQERVEAVLAFEKNYFPPESLRRSMEQISQKLTEGVTNEKERHSLESFQKSLALHYEIYRGTQRIQPVPGSSLERFLKEEELFSDLKPAYVVKEAIQYEERNHAPRNP